MLGADPGLGGAIALVDGVTGALVAVEDMPCDEVERNGKKKREVSAARLAAIVRAWQGVGSSLEATVEKVGAMPEQGVSSVFSFGFSAGLLNGTLTALGVPLTYVTPQAWKRLSGARKGKDGARQRACALWPERAAWFKRKKDDGRAEAALIAWTAVLLPRNIGALPSYVEPEVAAELPA